MSKMSMNEMSNDSYDINTKYSIKEFRRENISTENISTENILKTDSGSFSSDSFLSKERYDSYYTNSSTDLITNESSMEEIFDETFSNGIAKDSNSHEDDDSFELMFSRYINDNSSKKEFSPVYHGETHNKSNNEISIKSKSRRMVEAVDWIESNIKYYYETERAYYGRYTSSAKFEPIPMDIFLEEANMNFIY